jgi:proline dehydrogenase
VSLARAGSPRASGIESRPPVALLDRAIVRLLPAVPKRVVRRLSSRYIAGSELADAARVVRAANEGGKLATIDVLGEESATTAEAEEMAQEYLDVLATIERERLDSNVSVKPTAFGLRVGYEICRGQLRRVVDRAAELDRFVRIEMEDATTTDDTFALYRELRQAGCENIGAVLQSSLRRTIDDVDALADLRPNIRLVKGIYVESDEIQLKDEEAVRTSFVEVLDALLEAGCYVAIATHDDRLIDRSLARIAARRIGREGYEFQLLLGVKPREGDRLAADGHPVRLYVPYGRRWYEYSLRRLQENPQLAGYLAADTLGRLVRRQPRSA